MMNIRRSGFVCAALCAVLSACGNPGEHISFKAPANYGQPKNVFGFVQIWSTSDRQVLMLIKLPVKADPKRALADAGVKDVAVHKQEQIKICGSQPAAHLEMTGKKDNSRMDMIMSTARDATYMAMYSHPAGTSADAASENAIRSLCSV